MMVLHRRTRGARPERCARFRRSGWHSRPAIERYSTARRAAHDRRARFPTGSRSLGLLPITRPRPQKMSLSSMCLISPHILRSCRPSSSGAPQSVACTRSSWPSRSLFRARRCDRTIVSAAGPRTRRAATCKGLRARLHLRDGNSDHRDMQPCVECCHGAARVDRLVALRRKPKGRSQARYRAV